MNRHIALVEDNEVILANYSEFLGDAGFRVDRYSTKDGALRGLLANTPELLLLDIELHSERDAGFAICLEMRGRYPWLPIIFLTSHGTDVDKISGMRLGADDYITKDVSLELLVVRIEALFRRLDVFKKLRQNGEAAALGNASEQGIEFDAPSSTANWHGRRLELTLTQFWIVLALCSPQGQVKSADELMRAAKIQVEPNTIAAHIKAIRSVFASIDPCFNQIRTERGRGYRWLPL